MKTQFFGNGIARALVALVLGLILLIWPDFVANSFVKIIGFIALAGGIVSILLYFRDRQTALMAEGIAGAILGLILLFMADTILKIMFIVLAIVLIAFAADEVVRLFRAKASGKFFILPSVIAVMGIVILCQPKGSLDFIIMLFGVAVIVYAVSELITAIKLRG